MSGAFLVISSIIVLILIILLLLCLWRGRKVRKHYEYERQKINEAKLRFFTDISYDLRTPLSLIIGPLDKFISEHAGEPAALELEEAARYSHILMEEIDRILDFKQLTGNTPEFHPSYGDIARFTAEVYRSYSHALAEKGDSLTIDTGDSPVMTSFDRNQMRRILHCILSYTYKHRRGNEAMDVRVSIRQEDGWVVISTSDNGEGLSDKVKQLVQDRIDKQDDWNIYGFTMKLDLIMEYVRRHGGKIAVTDNHPTGTVFTFSVPINNEMKPSGRSRGDGVPSERTGRPLILNVEDNPAFRYYITENLSPKYDIVEAENGKEALELIADNNFDLILSDVIMPEMDGRELCRAIRGDIRYSSTPIILHTTIQDEDTELQNLRAGADDTLKKPFNVESLIIRIERLLKRRTPLVTDTDASGRRISRADRELLDKVTAEIEKNLQDSEYTIESLCSALSISRSGLYKKMVILTGKSPLEYLRILRLEKGREMLDNGETSVSQIAWNVGYSPKQFSKHFKDEFGCLPSEYIHSLSE